MTGSAHLVRVAMPDGAALATAVALPHAGFRGPALLVRTPYEGDLSGSTRGLEVEQVLAAGFALVAQDVRGRCASTGSFGFIAQERDDGRRTLAWIARQPWSDGRVATAGASYLGRAQLVLGDAPELVAMIPAGAGLGSTDTWRPGGTVDVALAGAWIRRLAPDRLAALPAAEAQALRALLDGADPVAPVRAALTPGHPLRRLIGPLLPALEGSDAPVPAPRVPSLHLCGWFDGVGAGTIDAWSQARAGSGDDHHLIVGPWAHDDLGATQGCRTFPGGAAEDLGLAARQLAFLACYVHGEGEPPPAAEVYLTGDNAWRTYAQWPPPCVERELALLGDGDPVVLASRAADPAPALGGPSTGVPIPGPLQMHAGPVDLRPLAARDDVAVLRVDGLEAPAELAGTPRLTAWVDADPEPAGLVARLAEVAPDGRMTTLAAGVATAPAAGAGEPARLDLALSPLHHRLAPGSRLALVLAAASHPQYLLGLDRDRTQRIALGDAARGARLTLPVVR